MARGSKLYLKEMYEQCSYLAAWLPNIQLRLGDVGVQDGEEFKRMTTLQDLGVPFDVRTGASSVDFIYTSQSGVALQTKGDGEISAGPIPAAVQAGVSMEFNKEGAFLFQAVGCEVDEIEDKAGVGRVVIDLLKKGTWEENWAVVDTLVRADSATIVVSRSQRAALELSAKAPVAVTNLADLEAGLSVHSQSGDIIQFVAAKGLAPLFKLSRVKKSLLTKLLGVSRPITFGGPTSEEASELPPAEDLFEAVAPEQD